ncbi:MAG TPA: deoxyribodipyrimidine photo-lyase [Bacteroidia bacterium]|nr:deoxyribodipyrimidine photo-lyase [Bacteroidia bacterium]
MHQVFSSHHANLPAVLLEIPLTLFWFRRDLRLDDNAGLYHAFTQNNPVLSIFIFDTAILSKLENPQDRRVDFIHRTLLNMQKGLREAGSDILVLHGDVLAIFKELGSRLNIHSVCFNHDEEPYARERDTQVVDYFKSLGIPCFAFKDHTIFERHEILKDDKKPYTVFTPYSRKWKSSLRSHHYVSYENRLFYPRFLRWTNESLPTLEKLGFQKSDLPDARRPVLEDATLLNYAATRDFPALNGTSRLSMHLRFGTVSIRALLRQAMPLSEAWVNELIWRDFYKMILWHFPYVTERAFKPAYDRITWRNNENEFALWCSGLTGFPIVDAGMRELNTTGFMHNRVRMIVSSFLVKDLRIDYRWGEAYFAEQLNDFDLSANNGGWQWAAGSGCDAAPYFRIFNPAEQQKRFDPDMRYCKTWIPELGTPGYPSPIVDHAQARAITLTLYKTSLQGKP